MTIAGNRGGDIQPPDNQEDLRRGASYIPKKVTEARWQGQIVIFVSDQGGNYWLMPDRTKVYE